MAEVPETWNLGVQKEKIGVMCSLTLSLGIYDVRSKAVVSKPVVHSAAVSCIVINDTEGYFITGSVDGEIKVWDLSTVTELTSIQGKHTRARLFRADEGVMDMMVDASGCLYSCGADGTVKVHSLDLPTIN